MPPKIENLCFQLLLCRYTGPSDSAYITRAAIAVPAASHYVARMDARVTCLILYTIRIAVAVSWLRLAYVRYDFTIFVNITVCVFLALS